MKKFLESLLASVMFLGFLWIPLVDFYRTYGLKFAVAVVVWVIITAPALDWFCERYPHPIRTRDCLRWLFRRR